MAREFELKFELTPEQMAEFESSALLSGLCGPDRSEEVRSVYFDTRKHTLRRRGMSLRIRYVGQQRIQTLKVVKAGAFERRESECELDSDTPDVSLVGGPARQTLRLRRLESKLVPVFETRVVRRTIPVRWNGSPIEIAIDRGRIEANGCATEINEVEFELKAGAQQSIVSLAQNMLAGIPARLGLLSKAERGYTLTTVRDDPGAVHAEPIELERKATVEDAFRTAAYSCLRHFALNQRGVIEHDPESVHQMRVGLRRLRAALSIFKHLLQDPQSQQIKGELRWLTEQLGPARDYDVFTHESRALSREAELHAAPVHELKLLLDERLAAGLAQAARAAAGDRFRKIVLTTGLWIAGGDWAASEDERQRRRCTSPLRRFARRVLAVRVDEIHEKLARLDELDPPQRHQLRINVKKLHYASEFFASAFPKRSAERRRFTKELKRIQETLGQLNDWAVHERVASELVEQSGGQSLATPPARVVYAAGLVRGQEDAIVQQSISAARNEGARLAQLRPFWR